ncbi:hypothetical protein M6I34_10990 [Burkholderiaceae bacterium FT117]|uniref:hypothetical protein n=1 Tax=Zeimonas sediminis TaxID=2944268 RepID=UPI00234321BB|nr:hypothetical protein [Zeimonas sediminis]MCM5571030.1 hypothetical protein [Zeimonas sediminis]
MDWFERLTGFRELPWEETRARLEVRGERLHSRVNGRSWGIGRLELASVAELRARAGAALRDAAAGVVAGAGGSPNGPLRVSKVTGDVRAMHADPANQGALFQVASQFNLLEMIGPEVTPEDGVSRYAGDHTQGPACAVAAGAATIYRNYFAPANGQSGQTAARQVDALADLGAALGNQGERLWKMRNGYALCTAEGLGEIEARLAAASAAEVDALRDRLRIGLHWDVEVTDARSEPRPVVSQAFCSALPVAYTGIPARRWRAFATLVLEGAYEATLWAAALNAARGASNIVYLTRLGGGAFGNEPEWIDAAMRRALGLARDVALDVRIVSFGKGL